MSATLKEWLVKTITELEEERDAVPGAVNEDAAMALAAMKLALTSLMADPVTTAYKLPEGWVACSERMPEDGEKVLTSFRGGMRTAVCKVIDVLGHKIFVDELTLFNGVPADHWQPLPAVPKLE
ncbi:TPA: DUF551 domain-containing protein [Enterobacter hormaechei subsp. steigerwaltii]